jgi:hypothetical protein
MREIVLDLRRLAIVGCRPGHAGGRGDRLDSWHRSDHPINSTGRGHHVGLRWAQGAPTHSISTTIPPVAQHVLIQTLALNACLPTSHEYREMIETGELMAYGPNLRTAELVHKNLRGTKPASRAADQIGPTVPPTLLAIIDEVRQTLQKSLSTLFQIRCAAPNRILVLASNVLGFAILKTLPQEMNILSVVSVHAGFGFGFLCCRSGLSSEPAAVGQRAPTWGVQS